MIIIGPSPPPYNGMSIVTETFIKSRIHDEFDIRHLDTADRRSIMNMGRFDIMNITLALKHAVVFVWMLLKYNPDMVYLPIAQNIAGFMRDSLFLIPAGILKKRTIIHLHGSYFHDFYINLRKTAQKYVKFSLQYVSGAIVLGTCLKNIFDGLISKEKIHVVPNGIRDMFKGLDFRRKKSDFTQILFLSNLMKEKGIIQLLKVIPAIISHNRNVRFVFAGEWFRESDKKEAFVLINKENLHPYITFTGVIKGEEKCEYLIKSHIFVMLSISPPYEGQPMVILEAMSAGLPVISTSKGAIPETIIDDINGFLIDGNNPGMLEEKLKLLIDDHEMRNAMGAASRKYYEEKFTQNRFIDTLKKTFVDIAEIKGIKP
ncbi:MAG: glycosyltransferase family 4 protein [bacterium]